MSTSERFDERHALMILERAANAQALGGRVRLDADHTLDELVAIGSEAGLAPDSIRSAAEALRRTEIPSHPVLGLPVRMDLEARIEGELPEAERAELVALLRRSTEREGRARVELSTLEWRTWGVFGSESVSVTARKGTTRVLVRGRYRRGQLLAGAAGAGLFALPTLAVAAGALGAEEGALPFVLAAAMTGARVAWGWFSRARAARLRRIMADVSELVEESVELEPPRSSEDGG